MEINRDVYLNRLITRKQNGFIKVITGIRRCGKSYLLNKIFYNFLLSEGVDKNHIIRFAFVCQLVFSSLFRASMMKCIIFFSMKFSCLEVLRLY